MNLSRPPSAIAASPDLEQVQQQPLSHCPTRIPQSLGALLWELQKEVVEGHTPAHQCSARLNTLINLVAAYQQNVAASLLASQQVANKSSTNQPTERSTGGVGRYFSMDGAAAVSEGRLETSDSRSHSDDLFVLDPAGAGGSRAGRFRGSANQSGSASRGSSEPAYRVSVSDAAKNTLRAAVTEANMEALSDKRGRKRGAGGNEAFAVEQSAKRRELSPSNTSDAATEEGEIKSGSPDKSGGGYPSSAEANEPGEAIGAACVLRDEEDAWAVLDAVGREARMLTPEEVEKEVRWTLWELQEALGLDFPPSLKPISEPALSHRPVHAFRYTMQEDLKGSSGRGETSDIQDSSVLRVRIRIPTSAWSKVSAIRCDDDGKQKVLIDRRSLKQIRRSFQLPGIPSYRSLLPPHDSHGNFSPYCVDCAERMIASTSNSYADHYGGRRGVFIACTHARCARCFQVGHRVRRCRQLMPDAWAFQHLTQLDERYEESLEKNSDGNTPRCITCDRKNVGHICCGTSLERLVQEARAREQESRSRNRFHIFSREELLYGRPSDSPPVGDHTLDMAGASTDPWSSRPIRAAAVHWDEDAANFHQVGMFSSIRRRYAAASPSRQTFGESDFVDNDLQIHTTSSAAMTRGSTDRGSDGYVRENRSWGAVRKQLYGERQQQQDASEFRRRDAPYHASPAFSSRYEEVRFTRDPRAAVPQPSAYPPPIPPPPSTPHPPSRVTSA